MEKTGPASVRIQDTKTNQEKIRSYCLKNNVHPIFFKFYDLWVFTKGGSINLLATKKAHEKWYAKQEAKRAAKTKPHVCSTKLPDQYTEAETAEIRAVSRPYRRSHERQLAAFADRGLDTCHQPFLNAANHDARHKQRHTVKHKNINFFVKTLTADKTISGPRKLRKNVVIMRLEQMRSKMPPPTMKIPSGGIQGELVRAA